MRYLSLIQIVNFYSWRAISPHFYPQIFLKSHKFKELKQRPYWGNHFWARGYCVDTVGLDEEKIRAYVKYQEKREREAEQKDLDF